VAPSPLQHDNVVGCLRPTCAASPNLDAAHFKSEFREKRAGPLPAATPSIGSAGPPIEFPERFTLHRLSGGQTMLAKGLLVCRESIMKRIMLIAIGMLAFAFHSMPTQAAVTSLTVTGATLSKSTGAIAVTGTIVCTAGDVFFVQANIVQVSGGHNGFTVGMTAAAFCSGGVDTWAAPQNLLFGSLKNGNAQVFVESIDATDGTVEFQLFHQPVHPAP
jgi:hypothetical protein